MPFYIRVPSLITPVHCITQTEEPFIFYFLLVSTEYGVKSAIIDSKLGIEISADSPQTALNQLILAWEGVKESYRQHGDEIPHG